MGFASAGQDSLCRPLPEFNGPRFPHSVSASFGGGVILRCLKAPVPLLSLFASRCPFFYGIAAASDTLHLSLKELSIVILKLVAKRTAVAPINSMT